MVRAAYRPTGKYMSKSNRKSLIAMSLAGLVFAAGSSAQRPQAGMEYAPDALAKSVRAAVAQKRAANAPIPVAVPYARTSRFDVEAMAKPESGAIRAGKPTGRYFVQLKSEPLVLHMSRQRAARGIDPTQPLDLRGSEAVNYEATLRAQQTQALSSISSLLGRNVTPSLRYTNTLNGFSLKISEAEAARLASHPSVEKVRPVLARPLDTDAGPGLIGAPAIWDGSATGTATFGEGVTVGIIDTGINSNHPSFAATAGAFTHTNPYGAGVFQGYCETNPGFCNDKLVGAYDFVFALVDGEPDILEEASPEDNNSHGSHTASTVAGNPIEIDFAGSVNLPISGVAPRANIIAYDTCYTEISTGQGSCPDDATAAAVEQAVVDGEVSVINFSIGGGIDPYNDTVSEAFLAAAEAGIYIAASAGNDGPDPGTLGHQEPWVATTAATTHNRVFAAGVSVTGPTTPAALQNIEYVAGTGDQVTVDIEDDIAYSGEVEPANVGACLPFTTPNVFAGQIALVQRGGCDFVVKVQNAQDAGAIAVIVHNNIPGAPFIQGGLDVPAITIPSVMIRRDAGLALAAYIAAEPTATVRIDSEISRSTTATADIMADFSSRGPNSTIDVLKPDIAAPGVAILAAVADGNGTVGEEVGLLSGTSMASPHNAGAAALLRALRPAWTPMQVKSALMLTAKNVGMIKEDEVTPADPFDFGNGRIQVPAAANAALVMNETAANFEEANPDTGGDVRDLNLASLYSSNCIETANCVFERTFTNVSGGTVTWDIVIDEPTDVTMTANPASFTINNGQSVTVEFTADATNLDPADGFQFGSVTLSDQANVEDDLHLNVAIQASAGVVPETITIETRRDAGSQLETGLITPTATDLTFIPSGLIQGTTVQGEIAEDSDNTSVFDDFTDGTHFVLLQPGEFGMRLVAQITATEATDLDVFIGADFNNDGEPTADEVIASSATSAALEYAEYRFLPAQFDYWILVQNWEGSATAPDAFTLSYAYVPYEDGLNLSVQAPAAPPAGEPYDITVFYNEPALEAGDIWYGALDVGPDEAGALNGEFGTIGVDLIRHEDDVTKEADVAAAVPGDTVSYTITVQPKVTPEDLDYLITDTLPEGLELVPASVQASAGTVDVDGQTIEWTLTIGPPNYDYEVTDSQNDPAYCAMPFSADDAVPDAYVNLADFAFNPQALPSDGPFSFNLAGVNSGIPFYGPAKSTTLFFNGNGILSFDNPSIFSAPSLTGANQPIPTAGLPNSMLALLWSDLTFAGGGPGSGVTSINLTSGGLPVARVIEFDNLTIGGNPANTIDAELYLDSDVYVDAPEIIFAYANATGAFTTLANGTIGLENQTGTRGVELAYNDAGLQVPNGYAVCFDLVEITEPQTLTFDAVVLASAPSPAVINGALHVTDNPGSVAVTASASVAIAAADLSITKDDGETTVLAGDQVTYTIVATNNDATNAAGATVTDDFPASLESCTWTCAAAGASTCSANGTGDIEDDVSFVAGGSVTYTATCTVAASAFGTLSNTASIASGADGNAANNNATDIDTVIGQNDLSISKTDGVTAVNAGGNVTYSIVVENEGASVATGTVTDTFAAPLGSCSWTCAGTGGNTCTAAGNGNISDAVSLVAGGSVTYTATCAVAANASGTLANTATIAGANDPNAANDSDSDDDTVIRPQTDLSITKTDGTNVVDALGNTTYTIVVTNVGAGDAADVLVTDTFPAPLSCSWTCTGVDGGNCTANGAGNIADTIAIAAGGSVTYTATCAINNAAGPNLVNTATVAYANDSNPANNSATDTNTVTPAADQIFRNGFEE